MSVNMFLFSLYEKVKLLSCIFFTLQLFFSHSIIELFFCLASKIFFKRSTETNEMIILLYVSEQDETSERNFCE